MGEHQHGFMRGKGIQEPSLLATHIIQDAEQTKQPLQLVSLDIKKAFDRIGHAVIVQALRAFGVPEILIQALRHYTLVGYAKVEVNGRRGILITIRTGSGQGDPLSSILFLIGSEPLNRLIANCFPNLMYVTREGVRVGSIIFADDNLSPLSLTQAEQINPLLDLYNRYTGVSGLNINVHKSTILCVNCSPELKLNLQNQGFSTPDTIRHLGIELGPNIQTTVRETLNKIDLKAAKRRILATAPPTDILHRATLINSALVPLYNHVLMALPAREADLQPLYKEIKSFLWTRTESDTTIQKRRLVAAKRLSASFEKGGLQIQHPEETAEGLRLNLLQKYFRKINNNQMTVFSHLIMEILQRAGRPSLTEHINSMGPREWNKTSLKIKDTNPMLSESFQVHGELPDKTGRQPRGLAPCPHLGALPNTQAFSALPC